MNYMKFGSILLSIGAGSSAFGAAVRVNLGTAGSFAVLAGSTVTNTGDTILEGNLGVSPGTAITGFGPGIVTDGTIYAGGTAAATAESDLLAAYNFAAAEDRDRSGGTYAYARSLLFFVVGGNDGHFDPERSG
jgi:hypothetical protein